MAGRGLFLSFPACFPPPPNFCDSQSINARKQKAETELRHGQQGKQPGDPAAKWQCRAGQVPGNSYCWSLPSLVRARAVMEQRPSLAWGLREPGQGCQVFPCRCSSSPAPAAQPKRCTSQAVQATRTFLQSLGPGVQRDAWHPIASSQWEGSSAVY